MTGITNAPAHTGFSTAGGDDFSLDLANVARSGGRGPDGRRNANGGNGNDGAGGPGVPGDGCAGLARQMSDEADVIIGLIRGADEHSRAGRPDLARDALVQVKTLLADLQAKCGTYAERCETSPAIADADRIRLGVVCRDLADVEAVVDRKLAGLAPGPAFDLRGVADVLGRILQLLGGIGRVLGGPEWQR